ncbi:MAG: DUF438 domain-containing protein, partial [Anaerolineaceae bacterium]|nr:DUF438 domain-containing protein [Anaerolineaceae bacterium]
MSEFINNVTRRKEAIKNILRQLHAGKSVDEVKSEFAALLKEVDATEIAEVEQQLIEEGLPAAEIQRLCDVHVAVFRESLAEHKSPDTIPGHPLHSLLTENHAATQVLERLREALQDLKKYPNAITSRLARQQLEKLRGFDKHYLRKENLLFPYLEKVGFSGPSVVMWGIHNDIRADWKALDALLEAGLSDDSEKVIAKVEEIFNRFDKAMREMFYKEENILFQAALDRLTDADWLAIREQEDAIGFFYVHPEDWQPQPAPAAVSALPDSSSSAAASGVEQLLALTTGALKLEQVNLMLSTLPVDLTFVDENDEVRFFSQNKDRVFERSPAIIGRKVQNCHPPQSMDRVQRILDDFRAGQRDEAAFWLRLQGKFIYICYYALRDENGAYRGTLEVTQDITKLHQLEGE